MIGRIKLLPFGQRTPGKNIECKKPNLLSGIDLELVLTAEDRINQIITVSLLGI